MKLPEEESGSSTSNIRLSVSSGIHAPFTKALLETINYLPQDFLQFIK